MEGFTAIAFALVLAVGGGATGAVMMSDGGDWMGGHHGMMGGDPDDCPYHDGDHPEECHEEWGEHPEECEEHSEEDCPYASNEGSRQRGGCCDGY